MTSIAPCRSKKGFTLIEVVVSVIIVTAVSVGFLVMFTSAYAGSFLMGGRTRAVNEAQSLIEDYYDNPLSIDSTVWKQVSAADALTDALLTMTEYSGYTHFFKVWSETHNGEVIQRISTLVFFDDNKQSVTISSLIS